MEHKDKLMREIDILKRKLESLIEIKENLLDSEVICTSRHLDTALNNLTILSTKKDI